jgi:hypothetical protein
MVSCKFADQCRNNNAECRNKRSDHLISALIKLFFKVNDYIIA